MQPLNQYATNHKISQNEKTKTISRVLNTKIAKDLGLTKEELEPYWVEFRLMSDKKNVLTVDTLRKLLSELNVHYSYLLYSLLCYSLIKKGQYIIKFFFLN